jgi:very-long-chain enoyl-CoA reductase
MCALRDDILDRSKLIISGKKKKFRIDYSPNKTVSVLLEECSNLFNLSVHRIRLIRNFILFFFRLSYQNSQQERPMILNQPQSTLQTLNIPAGATIVLKDLGFLLNFCKMFFSGSQINYRTVFVVEYLGPFLIFPLVFFIRKLFYSFYNANIVYPPYSFTQYYALLLWELHYCKRLFETLFVHTFSHATMPLTNLFKNCAYYWSFAFLIAYVVFHPLYSPPNFIFTIVGSAIFFICELLNFR